MTTITSSEWIYCREDFLVRPVAIYIWPQSVYQVPFFIALERWASLLPRIETRKRSRLIIIRVSAISEENLTCIGARLNDEGANLIAISPNSHKDISDICISGKNCLFLENPLSSVLSLTLQIELKLAVDINVFLTKVPRNLDSILDLNVLSLSNDETAVRVIDIKTSGKCPITLKNMEIPARGKECKHQQAFDARSYLLMASQIDLWKCPVCGSLVYPEDLVKIT